jgi:hypothetical protein
MKIDEFAPRLSSSGLLVWTILWKLLRCVPENDLQISETV